MVYQGRLATNLLQLYTQIIQNSFFIISVIIFDVNIVTEQKQVYW